MKKIQLLVLLALCSFIALAQNGTITYYHHGAVWSNGQTQGSGGFYIKVTFEDGEPSYLTKQLLNGGERDCWLESGYDNNGYYYSESGSSDKYRFSDDLTCMICENPPVMGLTMTNVYYNYPPNGSGYSGGGNYGGNSYGGSSGSSTYTTCRSCGGSGVCTSCNGKRGYYVDSGTYTGYNTRVWKDCPSCNGTGRCFNCHGTGRY